MPKFLIIMGFLLAATTLEATGDAIVRQALGGHAWPQRAALFGLGGALLFGYGLMLNLAPLEFSRVVGLYIATLFVVWQVINFFAFRTLPSAPILLGGTLILAGGLIVSFWRTSAGV